MKALTRWESLLLRSRTVFLNRLPFLVICFSLLLFTVYRTTICQYEHTKMEEILNPFDKKKVLNSFEKLEEPDETSDLHSLPRAIVERSTDLELKPLWLTQSSTFQAADVETHRNLLAIPAGIKMKSNVHAIVQKFFAENFTVILFHYDGMVDEWHDLPWNSKAIHIVANNQTKWWFAKRFLHPDVVSIYDYVFVWDEDLGVQHFHPGRYLKIMRTEGLEISQPALDPYLSKIHHSITIRKKNSKVHRRIYSRRGSISCSDASDGPPCTGWVESMAPVFSRSAWRCTWHLIQNDLIHAWGMDMKLGYCAQGDRTKKVGIIDSEFIVHQGIRTLGGYSLEKGQRRPVDPRSEIRRQSMLELKIFQQRWDQATSEDKEWTDPYSSTTQ